MFNWYDVVEKGVCFQVLLFRAERKETKKKKKKKKGKIIGITFYSANLTRLEVVEEGVCFQVRLVREEQQDFVRQIRSFGSVVGKGEGERG